MHIEADPAARWATKVQNERHIQTLLMALSTIGITVVCAMLWFMNGQIEKVSSSSDQHAVAIAAIAQKQQDTSDRIAYMSTDRYTGTQAAQDRIQFVERMAEMSSDQRDIKERLRELEQQFARFRARFDDTESDSES